GIAAGGRGVIAGGAGVVAAGGRWGTYHVSSTALTAQAGYVRGGFGYYNCFRPGWYGRYPGCWYARGWAAPRYAWRVATWPALVGWCSFPVTPVYIDYGTTVVYQGDTVYVNGDAAASAAEYAQQATTLADIGKQAAAPETEEWQPLGVFAM